MWERLACAAWTTNDVRSRHISVIRPRPTSWPPYQTWAPFPLRRPTTRRQSRIQIEITQLRALSGLETKQMEASRIPTISALMQAWSRSLFAPPSYILRAHRSPLTHPHLDPRDRGRANPASKKGLFRSRWLALDFTNRPD